MRIALTGATGLLGRNLLFEIIKQNLNHLDDIEIIVLGRSHKTVSLNDRIKDIIINDGIHYIKASPQNKDLLNKILERIIPIPFDLTKDDLGISEENIKKLIGTEIDYFFHVAALIDFRLDNTTSSKLESVNVGGTQKVLSFINKLSVKKLIYIGSAYSCGSKTGIIEPDYINLNEKFRNPYEESKLKAELFVREFAEKSGKNYKIFRPSTICGRLIEKPIGATNKFDVFYAWAAFFLRLKLKKMGSSEKLFSEKMKFDLRITVNSKSGLNVVPVDYAAKMLYATCLSNDKSTSYHLANRQETPHVEYIKWMFETINVSGYSFTDQEPKNKTKIEEFYYRTVGKIFTPYIIQSPMLFRVENLSGIEAETKLTCPLVEQNSFTKLMEYAKVKNFGLNP